METKRARIKQRGILCSSSDKERHMIAKEGRQAAHEQFINSPRYIELKSAPTTRKEPSHDCMVYVKCCGTWVKCPWSIVKGAGFNNWKY